MDLAPLQCTIRSRTTAALIADMVVVSNTQHLVVPIWAEKGQPSILVEAVGSEGEGEAGGVAGEGAEGEAETLVRDILEQTQLSTMRVAHHLSGLQAQQMWLLQRRAAALVSIVGWIEVNHLMMYSQ